MIHRILVPLDGSELAEHALPQAVAIAKAFHSEILLLRVPEQGPQDVEGMASSLQARMLCAEATAYLKGVQGRLAAEDVSSDCVVTKGKTAAQIVEYIEKNKVDLVVLCSHGQGGITRFPFGATVQQVIASASVSVLVVRPKERDPWPERVSDLSYRRILVPLDGSQRAQWALGLAVPIAAAHNATLVLAHVVPLSQSARTPRHDSQRDDIVRKLAQLDKDAAQDYLEEMRDRLSHHDFPLESRVLVSSRVAHSIERMAEQEDADLMVVSAHGHSGRSHCLYGGIAGNLINHSRVPLMVCQDMAREEEWEAISMSAPEGRLAEHPLVQV